MISPSSFDDSETLSEGDDGQEKGASHQHVQQEIFKRMPDNFPYGKQKNGTFCNLEDSLDLFHSLSVFLNPLKSQDYKGNVDDDMKKLQPLLQLYHEQIILTKITYRDTWSTGHLHNTDMVAFQDLSMLALCLVSHTFITADKPILNLLCRQLKLIETIGIAVRQWKLQHDYPEIACGSCELVVTSPQALKSVIFVARTYLAMKTFQISSLDEACDGRLEHWVRQTLAVIDKEMKGKRLEAESKAKGKHDKSPKRRSATKSKSSGVKSAKSAAKTNQRKLPTVSQRYSLSETQTMTTSTKKASDFPKSPDRHPMDKSKRNSTSNKRVTPSSDSCSNTTSKPSKSARRDSTPTRDAYHSSDKKTTFGQGSSIRRSTFTLPRDVARQRLISKFNHSASSSASNDDSERDMVEPGLSSGVENESISGQLYNIQQLVEQGTTKARRLYNFYEHTNQEIADLLAEVEAWERNKDEMISRAVQEEREAMTEKLKKNSEAAEKNKAEAIARAVQLERQKVEKKMKEKISHAVQKEREAVEQRMKKEVARAVQAEREVMENNRVEEIARAVEIERATFEKDIKERLAQSLLEG